MKTIVILFASLVGTAAWALNSGDTVIQWPVVNGIQINQACATETTLRSTTPLKQCAESVTKRYACQMGEIETCRPLSRNERVGGVEYVKTETTCRKYVKKHMEVSRMVTESRCVEWDPTTETSPGGCRESVAVRKLAPLVYNVDKYTWNNEQGMVYAGSFKYRIPACD
jgi:hypothetical protein